MSIELFGSLVALISIVIGVGFFFGKLYQTVIIIEEKVDAIASEVFKDNVLKISDFKKKRT